jgi:hypothetical protein
MAALTTTGTTTRPPRRRANAKAGAAGGRAPMPRLAVYIPRPCFHCNKTGHTQPNCPQTPTPASTALAAKRKAAYIEARDARRALRESNILALAATIAEESDTDNEQDATYSPCVVSPNLPATPTLRPCLRSVYATKGHSVSFQDVFIGEFCTLCPSLRHVKSKHRATDPALVYANDGTKPSPSSVLDYIIEDNSSHYRQWRTDFETNKDFKTDFRTNNPTYKQENPGLRWCTTLDSDTRSNTQDNRQITIPSVTLAAEAATFLGLIKKTAFDIFAPCKSHGIL